MMKPFLTSLTAMLALAAGLRAAPADLGVGDRAPNLEHVQWIQGQPVPSFEEGKVYVLDFWATWCGPCVRSIPHINALSQEHADDLSVIGVAIWPRDGMTPTAEYVEAKGDDMSYRIAEDVDGQTATAFMEAAGQNGIPTCMVVDQHARIAWIGHPMAGLEDVVAKVIDGTWDLEAARAEAAKQAEEARRQEELNAKAMPIYRELQQAMQSEDWDASADLSQQLLDLDHAMFGNFAVQKYLFLRKGEHAEQARAFADDLLATTYKDDARFLNMFAWSIASPDNTDPEPDLALALAAAKRAVAITESKDYDVLDTLARVHADLGEFDEAIEIQEKAVALAPAEAADNLRKTLDSYRNPGDDDGGSEDGEEFEDDDGEG